MKRVRGGVRTVPETDQGEPTQAHPEADQEELAQLLLTMATKKSIDAELAASESEGGEVPQEQVFQELMRKVHG